MAQQFPSSIKMPKGTSKTMTISAPNGQLQLHDPALERFKMNCVIKKDTSNFVMYLRQYVDGKTFDNGMGSEIIQSERFFKGNKVVWEVVPDLHSDSILSLFVYFPGDIKQRLKLAEHGKRFKFIPYQSIEDVSQTDEIPAMLFYEDDLKTNETEQLVKNNIIEGKLNPDPVKNKSLLTKIKRYVILTYSLN
jgi:hypothetical protein